MKILDYFTIMAIAGKTPNEELAKFALDRDCDVFSLESSSVITIANAEKIGLRETSNVKGKYVMCIIGRWGNDIIKTSNDKEELLDGYAHLVVNGIVNSRHSTSNITTIIKNALNR